MANDCILFVHGVNTRPERDFFTYSTRPNPQQSSFASNLIALIEGCNKDLGLTLKMESLHWYEVMLGAEQQLLDWFSASPDWNKFWFKEFRQKQILPFTGDAALYISRYIGSDVVEKLREQAETFLKGCNPEQDRLHLVTHSWGTVILFDILFAGRWDDPNIPGYESVRAIRSMIFGVAPQPNHGIRIASIHTMGSPIAIANLINVRRIQKDAGEELTDETIETIFTHDITLGLEKLLQSLFYAHGNRKLPWRNFAHPGDPIAYPLATVIPNLLDGNKQYLDIQDTLTSGGGWLEWGAQLVSDTFLALVNGGSAHMSYWQSQQVAEEIVKIIQQTQNFSRSQPVGAGAIAPPQNEF
ncbi:MAG: hypothetical protein KME26_31125 [Oscillatoria princeps RMCB-10]|jgi:hypothetical protein|nr:hypothetical protein [Oscillatoria princeps RMCB-10]